jgi:hypothetical protein
MSGLSYTSHSSRRQARRGQGIEFRLIYALSFVVLLAAVIVMRLVRLLTWRNTAQSSPSIIQEARDAAGAAVPYVFMG